MWLEAAHILPPAMFHSERLGAAQVPEHQGQFPTAFLHKEAPSCVHVWLNHWTPVKEMNEANVERDAKRERSRDFWFQALLSPSWTPAL